MESNLQDLCSNHIVVCEGLVTERNPWTNTDKPAGSERGAFSEHFTASQVPVHARDNLVRAKGWIETCLAEHPACRDFQTSTVDCHQRPTRVLEVTGDKTVKLRCNMANTQYDYLALSHMWGANHKSQIRLLTSNLDAFQTNIPWDQCSNIYQEAIRITHGLGHKYIWIDSLCIIQDSDTDWAHEARRMAIVYGNCTCNITYLFPPSSTPQQTRDDPRTWNPCRLRAATATEAGVYIQHPMSRWIESFSTEQHGWLVQRDWPLFTRAWTFQEYLLSPRTLLCGHVNLMFQCTCVFYDELLGPIAQGEKLRPSDGRYVSKARYFPPWLDGIAEAGLASPHVLRLGLDWMSFVTEYRARVLSFGTDRVVAFAGVASAYQKLGGLTYLAGLWWEFLPLCLLWHLEKKLPALLRDQYPEECLRGEDLVYTAEVEETCADDAPSWSWFSVPIHRFYVVSLLFNDDESAVRIRSERVPERSNFEDVYWAQPMSFQCAAHDANVYAEQNAFFDLTDLRISLALRTWPVSLDLPADLARQFRTIQTCSTLDKDLYWTPNFTYHPDSPNTKSSSSSPSPSPPRTGTFALLSESQIVRTAGNHTIQRRLAGLVLIPGVQEDTWKRVGVWYLKIRIKGVTVEVGNVGHVASRWKQYSLTRSWTAEILTLV
jgi:hypothetical protein